MITSSAVLLANPKSGFDITQENISGVMVRKLGPARANTYQLSVSLEDQTHLKDAIKTLGSKFPEGLSGVFFIQDDKFIYQSSLLPRRATEPLIDFNIWQQNLKSVSDYLNTKQISTKLKLDSADRCPEIRAVIGLGQGHGDKYINPASFIFEKNDEQRVYIH